VDSIQKNMVVKNFDRRKNPQNVQGLVLYLGVVPGLWHRRNLGIVPLRFNFTGSRCLPLGPYKGVCISSVDPRSFPGWGGRVFEVPQDFLQPEPCNVSAKLPEGFDFSGSARGSEIRF